MLLHQIYISDLQKNCHVISQHLLTPDIIFHFPIKGAMGMKMHIFRQIETEKTFL